MARKFYNFIWVGPQGFDGVGPGALLTDLFVDSHTVTTRGMILFPALLTPLVHVEGRDGSWFELLIATEKTLTTDMVNRQLKISPDLRSHKPYDPKPLFGGAGDKIIVEQVDENRRKILTTHSRFAGILHPTVVDLLVNRSLPKIYRVKVHKDALPAGQVKGELNCSKLEAKFVEYRSAAAPKSKPERVVRNAVVGQELHDVFIRAMSSKRFGFERADGASPLPGQCRYAFPIKGNAVDLAMADRLQPIQSYHPLVVFSAQDDFAYAHLAHVSDIHINSRWQILGKSPARVIEYGDGEHEDESPRIGGLVAETNRSFHDVLDKICASEAHVVIVGGDLVDHIRNAYDPARMLSKSNTVHQIWDAMDLDEYSPKTYPAGVDLVAFYSLVLDAMRRHQKPFFGITGNHDCYYDAFGISPRLTDARANSGIPADLNLTFYEALLSFGPTAGELKKLGSSFDASWFEWFHLVLTPFNDWWFKLPKQSIVGLGWGDSEDILMDDSGDQKDPHLPRSEDGVSDKQLELLTRAVDERAKRKVTLTSHFTFLSYREDVPMFPGGKPGSPGAIHLNDTYFENFSRYEMGTFETNRGALLDMLGKRQIQCVLSGHSHRRGLHLLLDRNGDAIPARLYDPDPEDGLDLSPLPKGAIHAEPAIIVSDSAGPYPRYNRDGEFLGWGSERPGGTLARFDAKTGNITNVKTISGSARPLPRAAVSMDYLDIEKNKVFVNNGIVVTALSAEWDSGAGGPQDKPGYMVFLRLTKEVWEDMQIHVRRIVFAGQDLGSRWIRLDLPCPTREAKEPPRGWAEDLFIVPVEQTARFRYWLRTVTYPARFISLQLGTHDKLLAKRYDWNSYWNFEVQAVPRYSNAVDAKGKPYRAVSYDIKRPTRELAAKLVNDDTWREVPPYDWRERREPKYFKS